LDYNILNGRGIEMHDHHAEVGDHRIGPRIVPSLRSLRSMI